MFFNLVTKNQERKIFMNKVISDKIKTSIIEQVIFGEDIGALAEKYRVSKSSIYRWVKDYKYKQKYNTDNLLTLSQMKRNMNRANKKLHILSTAPCGTNSPLLPRYKYIETIEDIYGLNICCEAMNVNKGSYLNYKLRGKRGDTVYARREKEAKPLIEEIFFESRRTYGANRIYSVLKSRGYDYGIKLIRKVMRENDMFVIGTNAKKRYLKSLGKKENILQREFDVSRPNEVWVSDVTELKFQRKIIYLCVILDLYARKVVAFRFSSKNSTQLTKSTLSAAYKLRKPTDVLLLFHSDQGSNYTSRTFRTYLKELGIKSSFSDPGKPHDNSVMESFNKTLKHEEYYVKFYRSERELKESIKDYIKFYNSYRIHSYNNDKTPDEKEALFYSQNQAK